MRQVVRLIKLRKIISGWFGFGPGSRVAFAGSKSVQACTIPFGILPETELWSLNLHVNAKRVYINTHDIPEKTSSYQQELFTPETVVLQDILTYESIGIQIGHGRRIIHLYATSLLVLAIHVRQQPPALLLRRTQPQPHQMSSRHA